MNWRDKYLASIYPSEEMTPQEKQSIGYLAFFLLTGTIISLVVMVYRELFHTDLASPIAEAATTLMFVVAGYFLLRKNISAAISMALVLPLVIYFYYLSEFGVSRAPSETLNKTLWWLIAGLIYLFTFSTFSIRHVLFFIMGTTTILYHTYQANILSELFHPELQLTSNPLLLFSAVFFIALILRNSLDKKIREITSGKEKIEREIRESFRNLPHPMVQIKASQDQDGNITRLEIARVNPAFEATLKVSAKEARNQELNDFFQLVFQSDTNWNDVFILNFKPHLRIYAPWLNKWFSFHILWTSRRDCYLLIIDITDDQLKIEALNDAQARYLALLEAIPDIFFVIDRDGTFQDVLFKDQEKFYPETSEVIGNTIYSVGFSRNMASKVQECIISAIENDSIETIEYTLDAKPKPLFYEMRLARLNENSVISIARDITRRKKAEFELEIAKTRAEEASALKSRFLANLSHDIRTPMNAIINFTRMLAEPDLLPGEKEEFIQDVNMQGGILMRMIDNTIQLSKIETNTLEFNVGFVYINRLFDELYLSFLAQLPEIRDLRLVKNIPFPGKEVGFETDATLLGEILYRLIENAVKFTTEGTITFGYLPIGNNNIEIYVEDTGPGIPDNERENIFLRFYVIEADRLANKSGPGLGLPIAEHFTALLGGELKLSSTPGKGSRFWFRLPLKNGRGFLRIV